MVIRWPRLTRGRHRPRKPEPTPPKYPLPAGPLVETWESSRTWGH